ncbi:single-strand selective monofunctional uracil-DNA glycosylase [Spodoptera frugiperda]|uniref:Single-strand selective monofunctional uracil-DNA glycosylase n=1 Tax=Spodoptera frugiperda TaxID=7108 RepID=A0A9R0DRU8_SPOFR|nr:single-strand selective monofunctional uracil-DNA glycosylase [Spodoptera frugiperda]
METEVVSTSFTSSSGDSSSVDISEQFLHLVDELNESLEQLKMPDDFVVYNPTIYAREPLEMYVRKYCNTPKRILFLDMNPGPFGMSQTGIPFGDIKSVRNWLGITGSVGKPPREIKDREVLGFDCTRPEVSGQRFWGLFRTLCGTPENFFKTSFVYNYSPQRCMNAKGVRSCIRTELKMPELYNICDPITRAL